MKQIIQISIFFFSVELVVIERVGGKYDDIIVIIVWIKSAI